MSRLSKNEARRTAIMNKRLLSELLDGATFPAIMLALAVSQINVGSQQRKSLRQGKIAAAEKQVGDRGEQKVKEAQGR
jgi:hypothetical protein